MNYANFWKRAGAMSIDMLILIPLTYLAVIINIHNVLGIVIYQIFVILFVQLYFIVGHYKFGQTIGKFVLKIKVTGIDCESLSFIQSLQRNLVDVLLQATLIFSYLYAVSIISDDQILIKKFFTANTEIMKVFPSWYHDSTKLWKIWYTASIITVLINKKRRALHDYLGNTVVIDLKPKS